MEGVDRVLKGAECCLRLLNKKCKECPYDTICFHDNICPTMMLHATMVIKAQQAEIDRLKAEKPKIIRCKDCKYGVKHELDLSNMYECGYPFTIVQEGHFGDFFCAMAEPKAGEQE